MLFVYLTGKVSFLGTSTLEESSLVCVKIQRPACPWELYICKELRERMSCMDSDIERDIVSIDDSHLLVSASV